jgi:hypothetical protein
VNERVGLIVAVLLGAAVVDLLVVTVGETEIVAVNDLLVVGAVPVSEKHSNEPSGHSDVPAAYAEQLSST